MVLRNGDTSVTKIDYFSALGALKSYWKEIYDKQTNKQTNIMLTDCDKGYLGNNMMSQLKVGMRTKARNKGQRSFL